MLEFELIVPSYNEASNLRPLLEQTVQAATEAGFTVEQFQLVVVENGSTDDSRNVLEALRTTPVGPWFRVVRVERNQGYGFGLSTGLKTATARLVGWSHADLQCHPRGAMRAARMLKQQADPLVLIKGRRAGRPWRDWCVSRVFEAFARVILGMQIYDVNAQPKVFPRELLQKLQNPPTTFGFDLYVLYQARKAGYRIESTNVDFPKRVHGASKWAATFFGRYKTILGMIAYMVTLARQEGRL